MSDVIRAEYGERGLRKEEKASEVEEDHDVTSRSVIAQRSESGDDDDDSSSNKDGSLKHHRPYQESLKVSIRFAAMRLKSAVLDKEGEHDDKEPYDSEKYFKASRKDEVIRRNTPSAPEHHKTSHFSQIHAFVSTS